MRVFRGIDNLPEFRNAVLTTGSFDGVHLGHRKILNKIKSCCQKLGGESVLLTLNPHPRYILNPAQAPPMILSMEEKIARLEALGIDNLIILPFDNTLANMDPQHFVEEIIIRKIKAKHVIVGYDHKFW